MSYITSNQDIFTDGTPVFLEIIKNGVSNSKFLHEGDIHPVAKEFLDVLSNSHNDFWNEFFVKEKEKKTFFNRVFNTNDFENTLYLLMSNDLNVEIVNINIHYCEYEVIMRFDKRVFALYVDFGEDYPKLSALSIII